MKFEKSPHHIWQAEDYGCHSSVQKEAASQLLRTLTWSGNEKILDVGCGEGKIAAKIADRVPNGSVLGLDISPEMICFAKQHFSKINLNFIVADGQQLIYENEFDLVFSSFALQWMLNVVDFFNGAYKSLRSSGRLIITVPLGISEALQQAISAVMFLEEWSIYFRTFIPTWRFLNECQYKQLVLQSGFQEVQLNTILQTVTFPSRKDFEAYVVQWLAYLKYIPHHLQKEFFNQIIDKYLDSSPVQQNGQVLFNFLRLDILARKPIL